MMIVVEDEGNEGDDDDDENEKICFRDIKNLHGDVCMELGNVAKTSHARKNEFRTQ
eukprot:CAMPEP_0167824572 /NCGR_PEP_ID=MMETSP0112_2-20121227/8870_1 /TAXON_ID=91324 /ORGANISM="Lotharella globosa, Strain CCCM811" /LENGTH=55 /DNA_ID=CAMNT_0007726553 /DNA_START=215 /DNA_END=382 /DNA_ORIENTATION=+